MRRTILIIAIIMWVPGVGADTPPDATAQLTEAIRGMIEPNLKTTAGVGFRTFECDAPLPLRPDSRIDCEALDDEGDVLNYVIAVDDEGMAEVVLASQPASQLDPSLRGMLDAPSRAFLADSEAKRWTELYAGLHPVLQDQITADDLRTQLEPAWNLLGSSRKADLTTHAVHSSGRHELVYALDCANGPGSARFGVAEDDTGVTRVTAFTLSAEPGTPLQATMLEAAGRDMLSGLVGVPITRLDVPLEQLARTGDAVEGLAFLADGGDLPVRAVQSGRKDDFDPIDYRFQVLDSKWLLERMYAQKAETAASVACPERVVPDGGEQTCTVELMSGERLAVTVARRGGDHRVTSIQPVTP
jgi:hypothetical protein